MLAYGNDNLAWLFVNKNGENLFSEVITPSWVERSKMGLE